MTDRERAHIDWKKGMKPKQITEKYGISINTVKSWIKRHWKNNTGAPAPAKEVQPKKKRGAPFGNKNAVGNTGGAPLGNKNNFKHGLYEEIYWDTLDEKEKEMVATMRLDEEESLLEEQIRLLSVRERRLMMRIDEQRQVRGGLALESVVSRKLDIKGNIIQGNQQTQTETTTRTISTFEVIQKLEAELTRVQGKKTRCIEALNKLRVERYKLNEESKGSEVANDWIAALEAMEDKTDEIIE